jgi:hypothetical protein
MIDLALAVIILGVVTVALAVDVAAAVGWMIERTRGRRR